MHLNSNGYGTVAIKFIKKMKILDKKWSRDSFCWSPNNYENDSCKITEFDKEKAKGKEHNISQYAKKWLTQKSKCSWSREVE